MCKTEIHVSMERCPFCQSEGMIVEDNYPNFDFKEYETWYHPECTKCPCMWEEAYKTIQEALDAWNKRG